MFIVKEVCKIMAKLKSWWLVFPVIVLISITVMYKFQSYRGLPMENYTDSLKKLQERFRFNIQPPRTFNTSEVSTVESNQTKIQEDCGNCSDLKAVVAIDPREWQKYPDKTWNGLQLPAITLEPMGRFGNIMGEYATLYALNRIYNVTVRLHKNMYKELSQIFPELTIPLVPEGTEKEWRVLERVASGKYANLEAASAGLLGPHPFRGSGWPFQIQLFHAYCCELRKEFTFTTRVQNEVYAFWQETLRHRNVTRTEMTLIGIHVRRTDYIDKMSTQYNSKLPEDAYFKRAISYYRNKYSKVLFVAASDDRKYIQRTFAKYKDIIFAPGSSKELDMAVLASCNHSIMTVGSFGFWSGYLTGGEVVYPDIFVSSIYPFSRYIYELSQLDFFTPMPAN